MSSLTKNTLAGLREILTRGDASSVEITQDYLAEISARRDLNTFITVTQDDALVSAKVADQIRAAGQASLTTGLPIAHKDLFCTKAF